MLVGFLLFCQPPQIDAFDGGRDRLVQAAGCVVRVVVLGFQESHENWIESTFGSGTTTVSPWRSDLCLLRSSQGYTGFSD